MLYCFVIIWFWTKSWSGPSCGSAAYATSWAPGEAWGHPPLTQSPTWPGPLTSWPPRETSGHPRARAAPARIPPQTRCHESCHKCVTCHESQSRSSSPVREPGSWRAGVLLLLHHPVPLVLLHPCSKGVIFILASILLFVIAYISEIIKGGIRFPALAHFVAPLSHFTSHWHLH